ncbi:MAG TPA: META domain-containing protein, partial [Afipia sp.]|nr:META domain-containing protein [Afipia sp.]
MLQKLAASALLVCVLACGAAADPATPTGKWLGGDN